MPTQNVTENYSECDTFARLVYDTYEVAHAGTPSTLVYKGVEHEMQMWWWEKFFVAHSNLTDQNFVGFGDHLQQNVVLTEVTGMKSSDLLALVVSTVGDIEEDEDDLEWGPVE